MAEKKYTLTQIIIAISAAVGTLAGGGGYFVGQAKAKQIDDPTDPKKQIASCDMATLKKTLDDHKLLLDSIDRRQFVLAVNAQASSKILDSTSARVDRLTRAMDRLSGRYNLGFACESMASGAIASRKIN